MEQSPERRAYSARAPMIYRALGDELRIPKDGYQIQYGPAATKVRLITAEGEDPKNVLQWKSGQGWKVVDELVPLLKTGLTPARLLEALRDEEEKRT